MIGRNYDEVLLGMSSCFLVNVLMDGIPKKSCDSCKNNSMASYLLACTSKTVVRYIRYTCNVLRAAVGCCKMQHGLS